MVLLLLCVLISTYSCSNKDDDNQEVNLPPYMEEKVNMHIGTQIFELSLFDNDAGKAFKALIPLTIVMDEVNGNEKFYRLYQNLPTDAKNPGTIRTGDLNLYGPDGLVLFYKTFSTSYSYTRIGTVNNPSALEAALGSGSVTIAFGNITNEKRITLTYNTNGATIGSAPASITENQGTKVNLNNGSGFSRSGFTFTGWNTQADGSGTNYAGDSSYTLNTNITLYAQWGAVTSSNRMKITVGSNTFMVTLASNQTATAFKELLPMTINMSELNNNEKYYGLSQSLPTNASNPGTIQNGDLMLYGSSTLVLFYKIFSTSYSYTRIGSVDNPSGLESALGSGSANVRFEMD